LTEELFKVYEKPQVKATLNPYEVLEQRIAEIQARNGEVRDRLSKILDLTEQLNKEQQELDMLEKRALELLIKRLER
jgi:predicted RNase H-like nuclease (RuvC/YqgF family)